MIHSPSQPARRLFVASMLALVLAGCSLTGEGIRTTGISGQQPPLMTHYAEAAAAEKFPIEAVDTSRVEPQFLQQVVDYRSPYPRGTMIVDPHRRFLYLIQKDNKAIRYGVGVGREGLAFAGTGTIQEKKQWPHWTPTAAMIARDPKRYAKWAHGMQGGAGNPLGARALYLFKNGKDTRYRIHGTTEPDSIGKAVSSGCIRMMNQDVIDLYARVPIGAFFSHVQGSLKSACELIGEHVMLKQSTVLRVARPTNNLDAVVRFYKDGLGLIELYRFENHAGFDGVMLGRPGEPYHFEFTRARGHDAGRPTKDNLVAFYIPERVDWDTAVARMKRHGYSPVPSFNPYWDKEGVTFEDCDGYRVVFQNAAWEILMPAFL